MEPETIRRYRDEASENLFRWAEAGPLSPARQHLKALLDEREGRIVALADALLDTLADDAMGRPLMAGWVGPMEVVGSGATPDVARMAGLATPVALAAEVLTYTRGVAIEWIVEETPGDPGRWRVRGEQEAFGPVIVSFGAGIRQNIEGLAEMLRAGTVEG